MKKLLSAVLFLVAAPALAQSIEMNVGPHGGHIDIRPPTVGVHVQEVRTEEVRGEGFRMEYRSTPDGATSLEVLEPEGVRAEIFEGDLEVARDDVPLSFSAAPNAYYRVVLIARSGAVWEKKVQARAGMHGTLRVKRWREERRQAPVVVVHEVRPSGPMAMSPADFAQLEQAVRAESFSEQRMDVIRTAASGALFTVQQVGALIDLQSFSGEKVEVVALLRGRIVDPNNAYQLYKHFTFNGDKEKVKALLASN